jgi:predicted metalloprotease with PDZ domain
MTPRTRPASLPAHRYRITPIDPHAHVFEVQLTITQPDPNGQHVALPAWIPGSYMIREFARHIVSIEARSGTRAVPLTKVDKHSWQARRCAGPLVLHYRVYAWDLSVRGAHLDASHAFFNGTSVFLSVTGQEDRCCEVELLPPPAEIATGWKVATTLPRASAAEFGFGEYAAADYDELIDHPVEMGRFTLARFKAAGARHDIAITGQHDTDIPRLTADLSRVCAHQARLFEPRGGRAPFDRYLFQLMAVGDGYGGLEHRSSTALIAKRTDLPWPSMTGTPEGYRRLLGLCSHEYFHAWHVKRIKPAGFVHHDLRSESYTRLLWLFEGFTSYYDDLMLRRAGVLPVSDYLEALAGTISSVMRAPGRRVQSVAQSSFDAWIKYYRQDENSPNSIVSYYAKGALVALALDLTIRTGSGGKHSLDDLMRLMWQRFGKHFYGADGRVSPAAQGVAEDDMPELIREATGLELSAQLRQWVDGTAELPLARLLDSVGVSLTMRRADHAGAALGIRASEAGSRVKINTVYSDSPAQRAGVSAGDELVAIDGLRADLATLKSAVTRKRRGARLELHAFRRDELIRFELEIGEAAESEAKLVLSPAARAGASKLRTGWLGAA